MKSLKKPALGTYIEAVGVILLIAGLVLASMCTKETFASQNISDSATPIIMGCGIAAIVVAILPIAASLVLGDKFYLYPLFPIAGALGMAAAGGLIMNCAYEMGIIWGSDLEAANTSAITGSYVFVAGVAVYLVAAIAISLASASNLTKEARSA